MNALFAYRTLPVKLRAGAPFAKYLYIKAHKASNEAESEPKATECGLFVAGIPVHLDQGSLEELFSVFGTVDRVVMHPRQTSAIVLYSSALSVAKALRAGAAGHVLEFAVDDSADGAADAPPLPPRGLKASVEAHKAAYPGTAVLAAELDAWMEEYEAAEEVARRAAAAAVADDGWTVVTGRAGRKRSAGNTVSGGVAQSAAQAHAERKRPKVADDFYRFQARERKKSELVELRKRFAEAQAHVAELRASRKFRPD